MRPTFLGFETARRGLVANQKCLDIVGNNLTNMKTEGYTRQRVDVVSISPNNGSSMYALPKAALAGQGVDIKGVSQIRDPFLDKRFREEYSDVGYYDQAAITLEDVEAALDEVTSDGLKTAISEVVKALDSFANKPDQVSNANIVMTEVKSLTQVLNQFDTKLDNIDKQQKFDMQISVNEVNSLIERIANLNANIKNDIYSSSLSPNEYFGPNELFDKRNLLLDELSKQADIHITDHTDGTVTVELNGKTIVDGEQYETMDYTENLDNTISLTWQSDGKDVKLNSGGLKAFVEMINGRGPNASGRETFTKGVPYYKDQIDNFAKVFAHVFNNTIPDDVSGFKKLIEVDASGVVSAKDIRVNDEWANDPSYIISKSPQVDGSLDNKFILSLKNKFDQKINFGEFTGTFEEYVNNYNNTIGQEKDFYASRLTASITIADDLLDRRDSVSAVSQDEEGANLMVYDKAYKAVSRVMTALDEALDVLINKTGLVGR